MQRKPYNLNTKYGRRKLREQADINYLNGTPEYRAEIDRIGCWVWFVIFLFAGFIGFIIYIVSGPEALLKWLR